MASIPSESVGDIDRTYQRLYGNGSSQPDCPCVLLYAYASRVSRMPIFVSISFSGPGARFTKYLTTILRLSYDNAIVTIDSRRTTNLPNRLTKGAKLV